MYSLDILGEKCIHENGNPFQSISMVENDFVRGDLLMPKQKLKCFGHLM